MNLVPAYPYIAYIVTLIDSLKLIEETIDYKIVNTRSESFRECSQYILIIGGVIQYIKSKNVDSSDVPKNIMIILDQFYTFRNFLAHNPITVDLGLWKGAINELADTVRPILMEYLGVYLNE